MGELIFRVAPPKITGVIKMKSGTTDYVGGGTLQAKVGSSQITGGVSLITF